MYNNCSPFNRICYLLRSALSGLFLLFLGSWLAFDAQAQVSGKVFRDFNANGLQDTPISSTASATGEPGLPGITVTAYPVTGTPVSVTSDVDGSYSFPNSGITASGAKLRLEFSGLPFGAYSAPYSASTTGSGTSAQFVTAGSSTTANYSANFPSEYCNSAPTLTIPCFISGNAAGSNVAGEHVVVTFPYSASSTLSGNIVTNSVSPTPIADAGQVGSVWGMAYQRETKRLFSAAFLKRHVGLGPGGLGGIYSTTTATGTTANGSLYVDLEAAPFNLSLGQSELGTRTLPNDATASSTDPNSLSLIGKAGLGSMALSEDGSKLYVVDLYNRQLLILAIGNPAKASLAAGDLTQVALPASATCVNGVARPFAVSVYRGKVYVGVVCTAESPGSTSANLSATVYEMDEVTQVFSPTNVFSAPLTYPKGLVHVQQVILGDQWETWTSTFSDFHTNVLQASNPTINRAARPQPILSDIDFTDNGDMVLSFMDRAGHQLGYQQVPPTGGSVLYSGYIGGDILRARLQGSTWILESAGKVSSTTSGTLTGCGPTNGQGPGNGEFYCNDIYLTTHQETSQGGAVIIPGTNATVSIHMDPLTTWSGGIIWFNNTTGSEQKRYELYHSTDDNGITYGKANGLGLPVVMCDPAPVEIGNRVWLDSDKDGIQDPDETPIASVSVSLYQSGTLVATAVTNAKGEYYFSSTTGTSTNSVRYGLALVRGGAYELRIATAQTALASYAAASPANAGSNDLADNDFSLSGSDLVTSLTVGMSGNNIHTFDAAVVCQLPTSVSLITTAATCSGTANQDNGLVTIPASISTVNRYSVISGTVTTGFAYSTATAIGTTFPLNIVTNAPNEGGTYTVRFYNGSDDCYIDQLVVVAPFSCACVPPVASAEATSNTICINQSVTVFAMVSPAGSYTYSWAAPAGAIVSGGNTATATISGLTTAGVKTFTVTVSSSPFCSTTTTVSVTVQDLVIRATILASGASSATSCEGTQAPVLGWVIDAGDASTPVQWYGPSSTTAALGTLISGESSATLTPTGSETLAPGTYYYAVVASGQACTATAFVQLEVSPKPVITLSTVCAENGSTYDIVGTVTPTSTVITDALGQPIVRNGGSFTVTGIVAGTNEVITGTSLASCTAVQNVTAPSCLTPCIQPVVAFMSGSDQSVCSGTDFQTIVADITSGTAVTYQWYGPSSSSLTVGAIINGANSLTYSPPANASVGTYYYVIVAQTAAGSACSGSAVATLTVSPLPAFTAVSTTVCSGFPLSYTAFVQTEPTTTYTIHPTLADAQANTNSLNGQQSFSITAATVYYVRGQETNGNCAAIQSITLTPTSCVADLGDYVWYDMNRDGQQGPDNTEPPVAGVVVELYESGIPTPVTSTTTNASGFYSFTGLTPSSYYVVFTAPAGTTFTTANSGTDASDSDVASLTGQSGSTGIYSLTAGEYNPTVDAGLIPLLGSIGDFVWKDANSNGIQDDGPNSGMSNILVHLLQETSTPGQYMVIAATTTSPLGEYNFTGLPAGNYKVQVDLATVPFYCQPTAQTVVTPNDATNSKIGPTGETPVIVINPANPAQRDYPAVDAGFSPLPLGSIGDYVWKDINNDGIQNDGATGVANVGMKLLNADGKYVVRGILSGLQENPSVPTSGTGLVYASFNPTTNVLDLMAGFSKLTGMVTMAHIHTGVAGTNGPVSVDLVPLGFPTNTYAGNFVASTTLTAGQATLLLANKLYLNVHTTTNGGGEIRAQLLACEFTNTAGNYLFDNLPQGMYTVAVDTPTLPLTCVVSSQQNSPSANESTDSDFNPTTGQSDAVPVVPMDPAQRDIRTVDLALMNSTTGSIGNFVWKDTNNNGLQDPNEKGIANVTVELFTVINNGRSSTPLATTVTSASGLYAFSGLPQGEYQLRFTLPASETVGCLISDKTNAGDDTRDSDIEPSTGLSPVITINPNDTGVAVNNTTVDLGVKRRIYDPTGYIYCYQTNTIMTGGTISVTGPGSVTVIKNGLDGSYQFLTDGTSGTYTVSYTHPSGYSVATVQRPVLASSLDPTGLDGSVLDKDGVVNGWVQIGSVANSPTNPTGLSDGSAAANPYYLSFSIIGGDPYVSENNLPIDCTDPVPPCPTVCVPITIGKIGKSGR